MPREAASSSSHHEIVRVPAAEAGRRPAPLPFDPVGKTHYTAEEIRALFDGLPTATDDDRTVLAAHPDRPATREELLVFVEDMWALHRAESDNGG